MRAWQFGKPKTPGFGISRDYFLTIPCSRAVLPSIAQIVNPDGKGGAATGFGVPLGGQAADKTRLSQPLERGTYAIATKDQKTVLQMMVLSKEEMGFDPEAFVRSPMAQDASPELLARLRGTWNLVQLRFESHDPMVYASLDFFLGIAARIADLGDGVVGDSIGQRYLLPNEVFHRDRLDPKIDARDHVTVHFRMRPDGIHGYTLGMQKFAMPEYEVFNLLPEDPTLAGKFMTAIAQRVLMGDITREGDLFGDPKLPFEARVGGLDRGMWEGIPVWELLPPTTHLPGEVLRAWQAT